MPSEHPEKDLLFQVEVPLLGSCLCLSESGFYHNAPLTALVKRTLQFAPAHHDTLASLRDVVTQQYIYPRSHVHTN